MDLKRRIVLAAALAVAAVPLAAQEKFITVASTTSTEQSGLFGYLLPIFEKKTGIQVRVVALGTGQALDMARRGDADVVFVRRRRREFIARRRVNYKQVMHNDFV
jgi:tungstate transport system substrate-binding protein